LTVPVELREAVEIKDTVVISGMVDWLELWTPEGWNQEVLPTSGFRQIWGEGIGG